MNSSQSPLASNQEYPLPDEFANAKELETFLLESSNQYLSVAYATEFADLYFKLKEEREESVQLQSSISPMHASYVDQD